MERKYLIKGININKIEEGFNILNKIFPDSVLLLDKKIVVLNSKGLTKEEAYNYIYRAFGEIKKNVVISEIDEYEKNKYLIKNVSSDFDYLNFVSMLNKEEGIDFCKIENKILNISYLKGIDIKEIITKHLPQRATVNEDTYNKKVSFYINKVNKELINFIKTINYVTDVENIKNKVIIKYRGSLDFESYFKSCINDYDPELKVYTYLYDEDDEDSLGIPRLFISGIFIVVGMFSTYSILTFTLLIISIIILGYDIIYKAMMSLTKGHIFNYNFLMTIVILCTIAQEYYLEAALVLLIYQFSEVLKKITITYSTYTMNKITKKLPSKAIIIKDGKEELEYIENILVNDLILVKKDDIIPIDGIVDTGSTTLDTSLINGVNELKYINVSDYVYAGSINKTGPIVVKACKTYDESIIYNFYSNLKNNIQSKTKTQSFLEMFSTLYSILVLIIALILAVVPIFITHSNYDLWIKRSLIFLVLAFPISINLSIPVSYITSIIFASKKGINIRNNEILEKLGDAKLAIFDYDCLLSNEFSITKIEHNIDNELFFKIISSLAIRSNLDYSSAILEKNPYKLDLSIVRNVREIKNLGAIGIYNNEEIYLGNNKLLQLYNFNDLEENFIYLAKKDNIIGKIYLKKKINTCSFEMVSSLNKIGISKIILFVNEKIDEDELNKLSIKEVYINKTVDEKREIIEKLKNEDLNIVLITNEVFMSMPLLNNVDSSITFNEKNKEYFGVYILSDNPKIISDVIKIAQTTKKIIYQNIMFVILLKVILLILAINNQITMVFAILLDCIAFILCITRGIYSINRKIRDDK